MSVLSLYQTGPPISVLATGVALAKAVRSRRVIDALFAFALVILPMIAMIGLLFLLGSADPSTAVPGGVDRAGMLILPP